MKLKHLEEHNRLKAYKNAVSRTINNKNFEGGMKRLEASIDERFREKSGAAFGGRFQMQRFDSSAVVHANGGKIKRTFSKDLFTVDRGKLRARHDER